MFVSRWQLRSINSFKNELKRYLATRPVEQQPLGQRTLRRRRRESSWVAWGAKGNGPWLVDKKGVIRPVIPAFIYVRFFTLVQYCKYCITRILHRRWHVFRLLIWTRYTTLACRTRKHIPIETMHLCPLKLRSDHPVINSDYTALCMTTELTRL